MAPMAVKILLNGREVEAWVPPNKSLMDALREEFGATEVKYGCGEGVCGTCTVLLDGEPINSCLTYAVQVNGHRVTTVGGLTDPSASAERRSAAVPADRDDLHPIQRCFLEQGGAQCGFCTPGMILTAWHFVEGCTQRPQRQEIREALAGNLCRCTGYTKILDAVESYADQHFSGDGRAPDPAISRSSGEGRW